MKQTPIDLYRLGNASSARLDRLRPDEVGIVARDGRDWVVGRSGGVSTFEAPTGLRGRHWWRLSAQTAYDETLMHLWNDFGNHWSWEPAANMPLAQFVDALVELNAKFTRWP